MCFRKTRASWTLVLAVVVCAPVGAAGADVDPASPDGVSRQAAALSSTDADVGLPNRPDVSDAAEAEASTSEELLSPEALKAAIEAEAGVEMEAEEVVEAPSPLVSDLLRLSLIERHRPPAAEDSDGWLPPNLRSRLFHHGAQLLESMADQEAALRAYERAISLGRDDLDTWRGLGRVRLRTGDLEGAEGALLAALEHGFANPGVLRELGELYLLTGELDWAVAALELAVELAPGSPRSEGLLARARYERAPDVSPEPAGEHLAWPGQSPQDWRVRLETSLLELRDAVPTPLRRAFDPLLHRAATGNALVWAVVLVGILVALWVAMRTARGRGDLVISIDYPSELRGTFSVRLAPKRAGLKRVPRSDRAALLKGGASTRTEHYLVSRETQFRSMRPRTYIVRVEGLLQDPASEEILTDPCEERDVDVRRKQTTRLSFDVGPRECPVDVKVLWDKRPAPDAVVAARGRPESIRYARGGPLRLHLGPGKHTVVAGSGDRVAEYELEVRSFQPTTVEIDLASAQIVFKGCPPAVEPYLHGDLGAAARALEREGQASDAHLLLARLHREQGQLERAAEHYQNAGRPLEAADLWASLKEYARAAELFGQAGDAMRAAQMYRTAKKWIPAGEFYERAKDFDSAIRCYELAGDHARWIDALERKGEPFQAARVALEHDDRARAIRLLQQVGPGDVHYEDAASQLAEAYEREGHTELAAQKLEEYVAAVGPGTASPGLQSQLADLLDTSGDVERALKVLETLRRHEPTYPNVASRIEGLRKKSSQQRLAESRGRASGSNLATTGFLGDSRYEMLEEIGAGGMGVVFKARDRRLNRVVALKRLPDNLKNHPKAVQLFLREAQASARLNHANITTVYDADQEGGHFFMTMELLQGQPLNKILKTKGRIAFKDASRLGMQICMGLQYAHDQGIVHRDIKTANLFFTGDRKVKIMDFGLAKMMEEVRRAATVIGGTPFYMAPEQAAGEPVDHRTDLYALGVTLFELVTGRVPFPEGDVTYHHRHTEPPDPASIAHEIPAELSDLILQMMEKKQEDRPTSAAEVSKRLERIVRRATDVA